MSSSSCPQCRLCPCFPPFCFTFYPALSIFFQSVCLSIPRQTLPSVPISVRLACPLPFHPDDPVTALLLLSVWLSFTQMPPTTARSIPYSVSKPPPTASLNLCLRYLFLTVSFACALPRSLTSSYSPTAQMPGLVRNSCLAMCHYQVLPSTAGPSVVGVGGCRVD